VGVIVVAFLHWLYGWWVARRLPPLWWWRWFSGCVAARVAPWLKLPLWVLYGFVSLWQFVIFRRFILSLIPGGLGFACVVLGVFAWLS